MCMCVFVCVGCFSLFTQPHPTLTCQSTPELNQLFDICRHYARQFLIALAHCEALCNITTRKRGRNGERDIEGDRER